MLMFQWFMWLKHNAYTLNRFFNHSSTSLLKINRDLVYLCVTSDIKKYGTITMATDFTSSDYGYSLYLVYYRSEPIFWPPVRRMNNYSFAVTITLSTCNRVR